MEFQCNIKSKKIGDFDQCINVWRRDTNVVERLINVL